MRAGLCNKTLFQQGCLSPFPFPRKSSILAAHFQGDPKGPVNLAVRNSFLLESRCGMMPATIVHVCYDFSQLQSYTEPQVTLWLKHTPSAPSHHHRSAWPVSGCLAEKWGEHVKSCVISTAQAPKEPTHSEEIFICHHVQLWTPLKSKWGLCLMLGWLILSVNWSAQHNL